MDSRKAWRMDIAERSNKKIPQVKQNIPAGQTKKSNRTNNIKTSIRK